MTAPVQPTLDGAEPEHADDYDTWVEAVWYAFEAAAATGLPFTTSEIQAKYNLPDPPRPRGQWGNLPGRLVKAGLIEEWNGIGRSRRRGVNGSPVHQWIGTRAARAGRAA